MSNSFAGIRLFQYTGTTYRLPVKLPQGVSVPPNRVPPSVCPVSINWLPYYVADGTSPTSLGVAVNLQASSVQASILDRIASVKIDNTASNCSVYVQFPDTGDVVNCPPNCSVTFPCLTNLLSANIYAVGLLAAFIPSTRIFFYNVDLPPAVDYEVSQSVALYRSSPSILRGAFSSISLGPPALGDQIQSSVIDLRFSDNQAMLAAQASGRYYITSINCSVGGVNGAVNGQLLQIKQQPSGNLIWHGSYGNGNQSWSMSGMNINLDATQSINALNSIGITNGLASLVLGYTYQP